MPQFFFDKDRADRAVEFFPRFLHFVEGEWAGKPFKLEPWQAKHIREIFGWRRKSDGTRRYRFVRGWVGRKNGKSALMAGVGHMMTIADREPGAQVYTHALNQKQARVVFDMAQKMVMVSPPLRKKYEVTQASLFCTATQSVFRALTGVALGQHGLNPHCAIGDEAHAWPSSDMHTFLIQGMGTRRQPLDITISTAGEVGTYGYELYKQSKAIVEDPKLDPYTYAFIHETDRDDDWTNPEVWAKANPNLGVSLKQEFLADLCERAKNNPRLENDFRRYHLNQWVEQHVRWFSMRHWPKNTAHPNRETWQDMREHLAGRLCFGGLDLGSTRDITALVWVFPPEDEGGRWTLVPRFWVPEETIDVRDSPATPYRRWVDSGAMLATPGNVCDYDFIEQQVMEDAEVFKVENLAIDRWNATQVATHLMNEGLPVVLFGQGYKSMATPSKELEIRFERGELEHGNHPIMRWMYGNATFRRDPTDSIKPDKSKAAEKIDGVVATVMGLGLALADEAPSAQSAFEQMLAHPIMT